MNYKKIIELKKEDNVFTLFKVDKKYMILKKVGEKYTYPDHREFLYIYNFFYKKHALSKIEFKKIIPKIMYKGAAITLTGAVLLLFYSNHKIKEDYNEFLERSNNLYVATTEKPKDDKPNIEITEPEIFDVTESDEQISVEVKTIDQSDLLKYKYIYDFKYIDFLFDYEHVTYEDFEVLVNNNINIPNRIKPYVLNYISHSYATTPDLDLRILYENMKTLKIIEANEYTIMTEALSVDAVGVYLKLENAIYVNENNDYKNNKWHYQVLMHELTHVAKTYYTTKDSYKIQVKTSFEYNFNVILEEALVSNYAVKIFNKNEKDIAYQLQSNYISIFLDCLENYELKDVIETDITYFMNQLDKHNNDIGYSEYIMELLNAQYQDYHDDKITIKQKELYDLYDYVSKMYYNKYLSKDMNYDEANTIHNNFIEKVTYDVPEEYNIDKQHLKEYFSSYYQKLINTASKHSR